MPNYIPTGPFTTGGAPGIQAAFLNAVEAVFKQPSGGTETGKYRLTGWSQASGQFISLYMPTLSRGATVVSVTIDTADDAPSSMLAPSATNSSSSGFQIVSQSTVGIGNVHCGGNWTTQY